MKNSISLFKIVTIAFSTLSSIALAQVPVANFSVSPNPVCSGNVIQITDLSSNSPTAWSYTVRTQGPGPGGTQTLSVQNPTVLLNAAAVYSISLIAVNGNGQSTIVTQTIQVLTSPSGQMNPPNQTTCPGGLPLTISIFNVGGGGASYTYSWSTSATTTSISVSPSVTSIYSCVITSTNGCSITRTSTVTIAQPTVAVSSSPYSLCPGSISIITAIGQNPAPFTYSWSTGATTNTISTNVAGVYDVTVTNNNGCVALRSYTLGTSTTLSLNATANPTALCSGNIATLRVTGGSSYSWSNGSTTANTTVTPGSTTSYTVVGSAGSCTGIAVVTISVSINPTVIVVSNPTAVCTGNSATLTVSGASTFTWMPSGVTTPSMVVTPTANATYLVRGNNPGCPTRTGTISLNVSPSPVLNVSSSASIICAFENVALAANGANTYLWNNGSTGAVIIVSPAVTTVYTVTGSSLNNCKTSVTITQSVAACDGIAGSSIGNSLLSVYPNPNAGNFTIESDRDMNLILINSLGEHVLVLSLGSGATNHLEVSGLSAGVYVLEGTASGKIVRQKIIVSR